MKPPRGIIVPASPRELTREVGSVLAESFREAGYESRSVDDDDDDIGRADAIVMVGNLVHLTRTVELLRTSSRPPAILWQLDSLPPPSIDERWAVAAARRTRLEEKRWLPKGRVGRTIKSIIPEGLRERTRAAIVDGSLARPKAQSGSDLLVSRAGSREARRRVGTMNLILEGHRKGWFDRVFVSTPERARTLARFGVDAAFLPIGYHPTMGRELDLDRDIDAVFLGQLLTRRAGILGRMQQTMMDRGLKLEVVEEGYWGEVRTALLNRVKVSLILGRSDGYWELPRLRLIQAAACGAMVVAESSGETDPFVPGIHFVSAPIDEMGDAIAEHVEDEERRRSIVGAARKLIMNDLTMQKVVNKMKEVWSGNEALPDGYR